MLSGSTGVHDMNDLDRLQKLLNWTVIATVVLIFVASFWTAYAILNAPWQGGA